jgi:sulfotransferase
MQRKIHFISGLPRSGSTLLAGILRQNPRFSAAMSSPVAPLIESLVNMMSPRNETAIFLDEERRRRVLTAVVEAYYGDDDSREVVFDTNRTWCARLPILSELFPEAKVICTVRNVAWIMDSFERLVRRNAFEPSNLFASADERASVYSRTEALALRNRVVGSAYAALKEAYYGEHSARLLLVDYDILARKPDACLKLIYRFLDEPWFAHSFDAVEYDEPEFDQRLGAPGLHKVSGPVRHTARATVLPPDLFGRFDSLTFWDDPAGSAAWRIAPERAPDKVGS